MREDFNAVAGLEGDEPKPKETPKPTDTTTISLRVTYEEKARLEKAAGNMALSAFLRENLLGKDLKPRKSRGKHPIKDRDALGRVLGRLGRADIAFTMNSLMVACDEGRIYLSEEQSQMLRTIDDDIKAMRADLMQALGFRRLPTPKDMR